MFSSSSYRSIRQNAITIGIEGIDHLKFEPDVLATWMNRMNKTENPFIGSA